MGGEPIFVTRPYLPPLEEFIPYLERIWRSKVLTNGGPMHQELEAALCRYLEVEYVCLFNNGTQALVTALQALGLTGEVITTPFSFVATSHSILWNNLVPVFVDVNPHTFNIDTARIEAAITPRTRAIMPVHCYGRPCEVERIEAIARRFGLKVVYDAAHAFGVKLRGQSVLRFGDLSVLSFHATKVFNTFEGGAIVCHDLATKQRIDRLKNFGIVDESTIQELGLNGKMSEVQAAFGLLQLQRVNAAIEARRVVDTCYRHQLDGIAGIDVPTVGTDVQWNFSYFPVLVRPTYGESRDALQARLKAHGIHARKYFFPLLSDLPIYCHLPSAARANLPHAAVAAEQVLCLPMYPELTDDDVERIVGVVRSCQVSM